MIAESLRESFFVAAQELGMWSASTLLLRELSALGDHGSIEEARALLSREYPIFDAVAARWASEGTAPRLDPSGALAAVRGVSRLLVVGFDADPLDAVVDGVDPGTRVGLVSAVGELSGDLARVLANYRGRVEHVTLAEVPRWVGRRSALMTFVYGVDAHGTAYTSLAWLRVLGPDVRTQFRSLVGWNLLGASPSIHPRWVVATPSDDFSDLVGP